MKWHDAAPADAADSRAGELEAVLHLSYEKLGVRWMENPYFQLSYGEAIFPARSTPRPVLDNLLVAEDREGA